MNYPDAFMVLLAGVLLGAASVGFIEAMSGPPIKHDPALMLQLETQCEATDRHATTNWCDDYAETYSRIK